MKLINDLMPLLQKAKDAGEDAKVMSVLAAGKGGPIDLDDNDIMVDVSASPHIRESASLLMIFFKDPR
ncbi:hypothetical protein PILCRDRAFT_814619 [Piloderma croceum F 1598]|uniref:Uncharacterized protein n=1 Tax=Piloderma croceum (strain F 1598) TaxID=765440 RepID=A0A0C3CDW0_PILCF|nr:hypothetical protein PILCRDRAFT_814619 [Piloderma croceum F 1598]